MTSTLPTDTSHEAVAAAAQGVLDLLSEAGWRLVTAESYTAGRLAGALAAGDGAGSALQGGFVCYSKDAKVRMLCLPPQTLQSRQGAVTETVARLMAEGARERSGAAIAIAVTGVLAGLTRHRRARWPEAAPDVLIRATLLSALGLVATMLAETRDLAQEPTIVPPLG